MPSQLISFVKNLGLFVFSTALVLLICEWAISGWYPVLSYKYPQHYFVADDELGFDIAPNVAIASHHISAEGIEYNIWSNRLGCFDKDFLHNEDYYLLVGDSFSWGYSPFESKWGYLLEQQLNKRLLKCAVTGYETKGQLIKAKRIIEQLNSRPEKILVGYYVGNDIKDSYLFPFRTVYDGYLIKQRFIANLEGEIKFKSRDQIAAEYKHYRHIRSAKGLGPVEYWLYQNSAIYGLYHRLRYPPTQKTHDDNTLLKRTKNSISAKESLAYRVHMKPWQNQAWNAHLNDINDFAEFAKSINSEIIFILIPSKEQVYAFLQKQGIDYDKPNDFLRGHFDRNHIRYFDLLASFREAAKTHTIDTLVDGDGLYFAVDGHWNENGNRLAAKTIFDYLQAKNTVTTVGR